MARRSPTPSARPTARPIAWRATSGSSRPPAASHASSRPAARTAAPDGRPTANASPSSPRAAGRSRSTSSALVGGEATKLTSLSGGADNIVWSPDGASARLHVAGVPRLQRRRVQRDAREGTGRQSREGARLRPAALPALDGMERRPPRTPVRRPGWPAAPRRTSRPAPTTTCRRCSARVRTRSRSRQTARRSPSWRSPTRWKPPAPTATSSPCRRTAARQAQSD